MNTKNRRNPIETSVKGNGPLARSIQACCNLAVKLKHLREQLMSKLAEEVQGRISEALVRKAIVEAEALAWSTQFPLLFLPVLAEEKVRNAGQWTAHQHEILERQKSLSTIL